VSAVLFFVKILSNIELCLVYESCIYPAMRGGSDDHVALLAGFGWSATTTGYRLRM
jgi:hypothetical protein